MVSPLTLQGPWPPPLSLFSIPESLTSSTPFTAREETLACLVIDLLIFMLFCLKKKWSPILNLLFKNPLKIPQVLELKAQFISCVQ